MVKDLGNISHIEIDELSIIQDNIKLMVEQDCSNLFMWNIKDILTWINSDDM